MFNWCISMLMLIRRSDIWHSLTVATHPDTHLIRRGAPLAVGMSSLYKDENLLNEKYQLLSSFSVIP